MINTNCDVCNQTYIECQYLDTYEKDVCWDCITEGYFTEEDFCEWTRKSMEYELNRK